jgi:hypothetical protein
MKAPLLGAAFLLGLLLGLALETTAERAGLILRGVTAAASLPANLTREP